MEFFADVGVSFRFSTKPNDAFVDALGIRSNANAFYGMRVLSAFLIGNIYIGVEASKFDAFGGKKLAGFTNFSVLPYIGFRTGFGLEPAAEDRGSGTKGPDDRTSRAVRSPSPTPLF